VEARRHGGTYLELVLVLTATSVWSRGGPVEPYLAHDGGGIASQKGLKLFQPIRTAPVRVPRVDGEGGPHLVPVAAV
jgi:hypothetical protein